MWKQLQKKYLGATVPVIQVYGAINIQSTENIARRLKSMDTSRAAALAVAVNSTEGALVQSHIICNKIRNFADKNNLKLFTFARENSTAAGCFILSCGHHVVADKNSIIGNIGTAFPKTNSEGILNYASLSHVEINSNKDLLAKSLNSFHKVTEQQKAQIERISKWSHEKFVSHIKKYRGNKIKKNDIFGGQIFTSEEALNNGLVDEIGSMAEVMEKYYPGSKLDLNSTSFWNIL